MTTPQSDIVLARLTRLHPKLIDLSLGRIEGLLAALGNPQDRLPPVIHVAGTNGKGSTVATLRACLEAGGWRVHAYTSPHLVRFHERIRLAGELIGEDRLILLLEECEGANRGAPITYFEITTAAALLAFARVPADFVLLETGLGGRLDATNVVKHPAATAITPISLDHQAFLGDTIAAIAGEKAGILKAGAPAVIGPQMPEAAAVFDARAAEIGAPLYRFGREWRCMADNGGMRYEGPHWRCDLPLPSLLGGHQIVNSGAAIACLEQLTAFPIAADTIAQGLRHIDWPARLQRLGRGPLSEALPEGWELWLDGGHNPGAGEVLAAAVSSWPDPSALSGRRHAQHQKRRRLPRTACRPRPRPLGGHDPRRRKPAARRQDRRRRSLRRPGGARIALGRRRPSRHHRRPHPRPHPDLRLPPSCGYSAGREWRVARMVVLERRGCGRGRYRFDPGFLDFARHCGFRPRLRAPYRGGRVAGARVPLMHYPDKPPQLRVSGKINWVRIKSATPTKLGRISIRRCHKARSHLIPSMMGSDAGQLR